VVFVIIVVDTEAHVTALFIEMNRAGISGVYFKSQKNFVAFGSGGFGPFEQGLGDMATARGGQDGNRIQTRKAGAATKQQQAVAKQYAVFVFGHLQPVGVGA
jgi:hypothetical protein